MFLPTLVALAVSFATTSAVFQGFNYGSTHSDGSAITEPEYEAQFNAAKNVVGTSGFTSARIYTLIQEGTTNTPSDAIQAAVNTKTSLLLGLWASAGQANINNELAALSSAISAHGTSFTDLIVGIAVGSEDLYRISPIGIENMSGVGAGPEEIANYIGQVKQAISKTPAAGKLVGHVDTWTAWVNSSNDAAITASDFIGMDAYPYFQNTMTNDIGNGYSLFFSAYDQTVAAAAGKPVWVTETGWPVSGKTENLAVPSLQNAKTYWDQVGCERLFGKINTFWFTLQDAFPSTPNPSFGIVGAGSSGTDIPTTPLYDLRCSDTSSNAQSKESVAPSSVNAAPSAQAAGNNGAQRQNEVEQSDDSGALDSGSSPAKPMPTSTNPTEGQTVKDTPALNEGGKGATKMYTTLTTSPATVIEAGETKTVMSTSTIVITSCGGGCDKANAPPMTLVTKTTALPAASGGPSGCPASLSGQYEYPHLIVPVSKEKPDTAQGTSYNGTISSSTSSIFNFDIPAEDLGKTCTLVFLLPTQEKLTTSAFSLTGNGGIDIALLKSPATEQTTYNNVPATDKDIGGPASVSPGNEYVIASAPCEAGSRQGYKVSATGNIDLDYFQDYNPSPIGLYITVC